MALSPFFNQQFNGTIWRMEIDELRDTILVEIRNDSEKQVSFAAISLLTGQVYFQDLKTPERWLTGMEAAYSGVLLLHNYQSENGPTHKGITAVDSETSNTLWSNYNIAFDHLSVNGAVVYDTRIQPRRLSLIDVKSGDITRAYEPAIDTLLDNQIVLPAMISPSELSAVDINVEVVGNMVHYLEYNNLIIVSLHALMEGQLTQSILIIDSGKTVYRDLLNEGIQKMQPEAFIVHKNRLIYIKNKTELKVLTL